MQFETVPETPEVSAIEDAAPEQLATPPDTQEGEADSSTAVEETADASQAPKPRGVGARIDELTRNWREAERREAALLALLQSRQDAPTPQAPEPEPVKAAPTLAQFDYDEAKYQAALIEYTRAEARREVETLLARKEAETAERAKAQTFEKRQAEFLAKRPDYADKVLSDRTLPISPTMAEVIKESEDGPELAYYLAENRELAAQIAQLPERAAARELGRIEAKLAIQRETAAKPAPKPAVSQAPPPPPRIEGVTEHIPVRTTDASGDVLSDREWVLAERKRELAKRQGR